VILTGITSWSVHSEQRLPDSSTASFPAARPANGRPAPITRILGQRFDQRPDPLRILRRRRTIDHHGEIGPAVDGEGRVLHREQAATVCRRCLLPSP